MQSSEAEVKIAPAEGDDITMVPVSSVYARLEGDDLPSLRRGMLPAPPHLLLCAYLHACTMLPTSRILLSHCRQLRAGARHDCRRTPGARARNGTGSHPQSRGQHFCRGDPQRVCCFLQRWRHVLWRFKAHQCPFCLAFFPASRPPMSARSSSKLLKSRTRASATSWKTAWRTAFCTCSGDLT